jgi:hypothetical protein
VIAWKERGGGGRLMGFSPMAALGGGAMKMATRQCSTKATDGAPIWR